MEWRRTGKSSAVKRRALGAMAERRRCGSNFRRDAVFQRLADLCGIPADSFSGLEKRGCADRSLPYVTTRRGDPRVGPALGIDSRGSEKVVSAWHSTLQHAGYGLADPVLEGG